MLCGWENCYCSKFCSRGSWAKFIIRFYTILCFSFLIFHNELSPSTCALSVQHNGHLECKVNQALECYVLIDNVFDKSKQQNIHDLFTMWIKNIIYCIELRAENVSPPPHTGLVSKVIHLKLFYISSRLPKSQRVWTRQSHDSDLSHVDVSRGFKRIFIFKIKLPCNASCNIISGRPDNHVYNKQDRDDVGKNACTGDELSYPSFYLEKINKNCAWTQTFLLNLAIIAD